MLPCVHEQEPHNLIKERGKLACPWCELETVRARLAKAEAIVSDALTCWNAHAYPALRQLQLQMATYQAFSDGKAN